MRALVLFRNKWIPLLPRLEGSGYFELSGWRKNWGSAFSTVSAGKTNNPVEKHNASIKSELTHYKMHPMMRFLKMLRTTTGIMGKSSVQDKTMFSMNPNSAYDRSLIPIWQQAKIIHSNIKWESVREIEFGGTKYIVMPYDLKDTVAFNELSEIERHKLFTCETFDQWAECLKNTAIITFMSAADIEPLIPWRGMRCTCRAYHQNFICKHVIICSIELGCIHWYEHVISLDPEKNDGRSVPRHGMVYPGECLRRNQVTNLNKRIRSRRRRLRAVRCPSRR